MKGKDFVYYGECCRSCNGTGVGISEKSHHQLADASADGLTSFRRNVASATRKTLAQKLASEVAYTNGHGDALACQCTNVATKPYATRGKGTRKTSGNHENNHSYPVCHVAGVTPKKKGSREEQLALQQMVDAADMHSMKNIHIMRQQTPTHTKVTKTRLPKVTHVNHDDTRHVMSNSSRILCKAREILDRRLQQAVMTTLEHDCCTQRSCGNLAASFAMISGGQSLSPRLSEPVFMSYYTSDFEDFWDAEEEDGYDISFTNFDFRTVSGDTFEDDLFDDDPMPLIDMICGTSDTSDQKSNCTGTFTLVDSFEAPEEIYEETAHYGLPRGGSGSNRWGKSRKGKGGRAHKEHTVSAHKRTAAVVAESNYSNVATNVEEAGNGEDVEWYPGFSRQLGAKGRSALLDLVRRVYRQDPNHYKAILQARKPPSSISNLPFFNIPMLWELCHQFGVFKQAVMLHRNQQSSSVKGDRNRSKSKAEKVERVATVVTEAAVEPLTQEVQSQDTIESEHVELVEEEETSKQTQVTKRANVPLDETIELEHVSKYQRVLQNAPSQPDPLKQGMTSLSGRSIKPSRRYAEYQDEYVKVMNADEILESDDTEGFVPTYLQTNGQSLDISQTNVGEVSDENPLEKVMNTLQLSPQSLVWRVAQQLTRKDLEEKPVKESIASVSSAHSTPTRCISV